MIPTRHCVNLSAALFTVLYDRHAKRVHDGLELPHSTAGEFDEPPLTAVISAWSAIRRTKVACAISDQMILTGAAEHLSHELVVRLQARPSGRLPCLVLGDSGVDIGFLDLLGGCAVPQGLQHAVVVHRNHDSRFAAETDDIVTVMP